MGAIRGRSGGEVDAQGREKTVAISGTRNDVEAKGLRSVSSLSASKRTKSRISPYILRRSTDRRGLGKNVGNGLEAGGSHVSRRSISARATGAGEFVAAGTIRSGGVTGPAGN